MIALKITALVLGAGLPLELVAMAENIIGITLERDARMISSHPHVERIVEKEIRQ
jgi:hypothetical protein